MNDSETTLKAIVDLYHQGADVFFGPENNCVFSAKLAAALNRPMIGYVSQFLHYSTYICYSVGFSSSIEMLL